MNRFSEKFWLAWSLTAVFGLLVLGSVASGQSATTPQSNWMQIGPQEIMRSNWGTVFQGPRLEPGPCMVWVAVKQNDSPMPYRVWRSFGPFDAVAGHAYLVTIEHDGIPTLSWRPWTVLEPQDQSLSAVHYLNQMADDVVLGVVTVPVAGPVSRVVIADALGSADGRDSLTGCPQKVYPIVLEKGNTYVIDMRSTEFDTYLMLEDECGETVAQNDADIVLNHDAMNSRMTIRATRDGTFRLVASTFSPSSLGSFSIAVREVPILNVFKDHLTTTDNVRNDSYSKEYEVTLVAGRRYVIDLQSNDFATCVKLLNSDGAIVAFDEGGGMEMNTRIASYQAPMTGPYRIIVTSSEEHRTGAFNLTVREDE